VDGNLIWSILQAVWPLLFAAAILREIGNFFKRVTPPPETGFWAKAFWITLPLHPVVIGGLFGATKLAPVSELVEMAGSHAGILYYAGAGFISVYYHDIINTAVKYGKKSDETV
jgi:hypothetical protein